VQSLSFNKLHRIGLQFKNAGNLDFSPVYMRDSDENKLQRNAHIRNKFHRSPFVCLGNDTSEKVLGLFTLRVHFTNFMQATTESSALDRVG